MDGRTDGRTDSASQKTSRTDGQLSLLWEGLIHGWMNPLTKTNPNPMGPLTSGASDFTMGRKEGRKEEEGRRKREGDDPGPEPHGALGERKRETE